MSSIQFTKEAGKPQLSLILPVLGMSAGAITHALRRRDLPLEEKDKDLVKSLLLGGLSGSGMELMRYGGLSALHHLGSWDTQIPKGTRGVIVPPASAVVSPSSMDWL